MNWPRYKFSKESEPELIEFFKAVAEQKSPTTTSNINLLWQKLLPVDEAVQQHINSFKTTMVNEVIDITESDDENNVTENNTNKQSYPEDEFLLPDESFTQLTASESNLNTTTTEDLVDGVQELLQTEPILSEDIIKQLGSKCPLQMLQKMFKIFASDLNVESTLKLWKSISRANCMERNIVASCFSQYILVHKIMNEHDNAVKILFAEVFSAFSDEVIAVLQKVLLQANITFDLTILRSNLSTLPDEYKNTLMRIFKDHCTKLELHHLGTVLSLITAHTDEENLNKLVELMFNTAKDFAGEKTFGKLLLEVLQALGSNVLQNEHQLKYIISIHKSVFKTQISKIFENCLRDHKIFSQSSRV